ncbi:hypothetical protein EK904_001540, partial [Melospiza melodia maxima]
LLPLFFASGFVGEDITVMSAFNLLHLVTKSQPVALRACGLPSVLKQIEREVGYSVFCGVIAENEQEQSVPAVLVFMLAFILVTSRLRDPFQSPNLIPSMENQMEEGGSCRDKKDCKVVFSQEELRKRLTPLQYHVTQEKGTERISTLVY